MSALLLGEVDDEGCALSTVPCISWSWEVGIRVLLLPFWHLLGEYDDEGCAVARCRC